MRVVWDNIFGAESLAISPQTGVPCRTKAGRGAGTRTLDPLIKSQLLCQLSYTSNLFSRAFPEETAREKMERAKGFEPSTATLARWSSTTELRSLLRKHGVMYANQTNRQLFFYEKTKGAPVLPLVMVQERGI